MVSPNLCCAYQGLILTVALGGHVQVRFWL